MLAQINEQHQHMRVTRLPQTQAKASQILKATASPVCAFFLVGAAQSGDVRLGER